MNRFSLVSLAILSICLMPRMVSAEFLCGSGCNLEITFSSGGSIHAVEETTVIFGSGGLIDDGATAIGYVAGDSLLLSAGDILAFDAGGRFVLGSAGNIDYSALAITVQGDVTISASPGEEISWHGDSTMTVSGQLIIEAPVTLSATLDLTGASLMADALAINGGGAVNVTSSGALLLDSEPVTLSSTPEFMASAISFESISPGIGIIHSGEITLVLPDDLSGLEGVELPLADGGSCTVAAGVCVDSAGNRYVAQEGQLVAEHSTDGNAVASGAFDPLSMLVLLMAIGIRLYPCSAIAR